MVPPPSAPSSLKSWNPLFSLRKKTSEDRQLLSEQLAYWCDRRGLDAAALYAEEVDGKYHLQAYFGTKPWPPILPEVLEAAWRRISMPGAVLIHRGNDEDAKAEESDLALILAGARISALKQRIQQQSFQARFRGVELQSLYEVGLAIGSTLKLDELAEEVLLRAVSLLDARRGALYLLEDKRYQLQYSIAGEALESFTGEEISIANLLSGDLEIAERLLPDVSHILAVPIELDGQPRGLLIVADKESRRGVGPFPANDLRTLSLLGNQAAIALENAKLHMLALEKERLERDMELAAEIQGQILPKDMPQIPGFEVLGWNRPARQVGGDYFDVQSCGEGRWWLVVGDVTGKGLPAALMVSTLHSALSLLIDRFEVGPAMVSRLNRHIHDSSGLNKFITMLLAEVDIESGTLRFLNAGHNQGLLIRADDSVEEMPSGGLPLGLLPKGQYTASELDLKPGDLVCLYSDGITECAAPDEDEYGLGRLIELLLAKRDAPLEDIITEIDQAMIAFAADLPQGDDQTVLLLRRRAE